MISPLVSIVMPVKNEERFLSSAIRSIINQSFHLYELIVVDDGSTDATPDILEKLSSLDSRIKVYKNPDSGLPSALNYGVNKGGAEIIARMDGDDVCHPSRLQKQFDYLQKHPEVDLVASNFDQFPRKSIKSGMIAYQDWQNRLHTHDEIIRDIFVESPFVHPTVMMRREIYERAGGYRETGWAEDYDLWLRIAESGGKFFSIPEILFYWRDRPERCTRTMHEYTLDAFRRCKLHHLKRGFLENTDSVVLVGAGKEGRAWGRLLKSNGIKIRYWIDLDPSKIGSELHGAKIISHLEIPQDSDKMLVTIGVKGARGEVRDFLSKRGFIDGSDFLCVT